MPTRRSKTEIVTVSASSLALCLVVLLLITLAVIFSTGGEDLLTNILIGSDASVSLTTTAQTDISGTISQIFGNELLGRTVVFAVWAFIGLMVLTLISGVQTGLRQMREAREEMQYVNQDRNLFKHTLQQRLLFRCGLALAWGLYAFMYLQFCIPFYVASSHIALSGQATATDYAYAFLGAALLLVATHFHVVFARLFRGHVRVWGG